MPSRSINRRSALIALVVLSGCGRVHLGTQDGGSGDGGHGEPCGMTVCDVDLVCCNASCGICASAGEACPAIACGPSDCTSNGDCAPTEHCALPDGQCGPGPALLGSCTPRPEVCEPVFGATCGCDGVTYRSRCDAALGGISIAHDGPCEMPLPLCAPQDAAGAGACDLFLGFRWNGAYCEGVTGCTCTGVDCGAIDSDRASCEAAHAGCAPCARADARESCLPDFVTSYAWDGTRCVGLACCMGADCAGTYETIDQCMDAHVHCGPATPCIINDDCTATQFCKYAYGACLADGVGTCTPRPMGTIACPLGGETVCGCDGHDYLCEAEASQAGTSVLHFGTCAGACGPMDARSSGDDCTNVVGVAWNGIACEAVVCGCVGTECDRLFASASECNAAYVRCDQPPGGLCGGFVGATCRPDEWCDFPDPHFCGGGDDSGVCTPRPTACSTEVDPVCGCDGLAYDNACLANRAGHDTRTDPMVSCGAPPP